MKAMTEFSFSFAFTHELLTQLPSADAAPYFPSLRAEALLGYDLKVGFNGIPIYLQYKLSEGLTRGQAKYWAKYNGEYYRFDITSLRVSQQHDILKDLSVKEPHVYYVAPVFWKIGNFNIYYQTNRILDNSICVPLRRLPYLPDFDQHHVTYANTRRFDWHSTDDDTASDDFSGTHLAESIRDQFDRKEFIKIDDDFIGELYSAIHSMILRREEGMEAIDTLRPGPGGLAGVQYLLRTYLGIELLLLRDVTTQGT